MGKLKNKVVFLFILVILALYIVIYILPRFSTIMDETYVAEFGELSVYDETNAYFVRDERVYTAAVSGRVNRLAQEGDLLRVGTAAIDITSGEYEETSEALTRIRDNLGENVTCIWDYRVETGGIVSYFVDGNENLLTMENAPALSYESLENIKQEDVVTVGEGDVSEGYPVFKVISNGKWYIVAFIDGEHISRYTPNYSVEVSFMPGGFKPAATGGGTAKVLDMNIVSVEKVAQHGKLILESSGWFSELGEYRNIPCRIATSHIKGLLIEESSIVTLDDVTGVYVKNKMDGYDFVPISILGTGEGKVIIKESYFYDDAGERVRTVDPYDDILRNPSNAEKDESNVD